MAKFAILVSKKDLAGLNIKERLVLGYPFLESGSFQGEPSYSMGEITIYTLKNETIFSENIDEQIDADIFIFATKHESKSKIPTLSIHAPGNFGEADYGGLKNTLCLAPGKFLKEMFIILNKISLLPDFDVVMECTHHGPYLKKPCLFIEIGSSISEWKNESAGEIIAKTIVEAITKEIPECETALGIGGLHTCSNFLKVQLHSKYALTHICPKYMLNNFSELSLSEAIDKSVPKPKIIILDWKGLGEHKEKIKEICLKSKLEVYRTTDF